MHFFIERDVLLRRHGGAVPPAPLVEILLGTPAAPATLELNQHGWRHANHEREGRKCEFGPSRAYAEQLADIAHGQARMTEAFGPHWFPVFIPPWNRCVEDTYRALDQLDFRALSVKQGHSVVTGYRFKEISITLDLFNWRGGASLKPAEEFIDELVAQLSQRRTIGVMLHHEVMDELAFAFLESLLDALATHPSADFHTFRSLLQLGK